jgi:hypothetical protein
MIQSKQRLIQELEQAPDSLIEEVLNYLLFTKSRLSEKVYIPQTEFIEFNNPLAGLFADDPDQMDAVMHSIESDRIYCHHWMDKLM